MYGFVFRLLLRFVVDVEEEARRIGVPFIVSVLALVLVIVEVLEGITIFDLFSEDLLFFDGGAVKVHVWGGVAFEHAVIILLEETLLDSVFV